FILMEDSKCSKCNCQRYKVQAGKENVVANFTKKKFRISVSIVVTLKISIVVGPTTSTRNFRNASRPASESVTVKHLLLFEEESPNMLPKEGSVKWNNMMDKRLIKENFKISINDDIFNEFCNLFGIADQSTKFKLYSPTNGKPVKLNDEPSFEAPGSNFMEALFEGSNFDVPSQSMELNNEAARKDDGIEYETTRGIIEYFRFDPNTDPVEVTAHPPR
ncbi:12400_t:CDS:2, partial [Rhizophagus irregularis]